MCSYGHWNLGLTRLQSSFVVVGKGKKDGMELYHIDRSLCKQIKVTLKPNQKSGKYHKEPTRIQNRFKNKKRNEICMKGGKRLRLVKRFASDWLKRQSEFSGVTCDVTPLHGYPTFRRPLVKFIRPEVWLRRP